MSATCLRLCLFTLLVCPIACSPPEPVEGLPDKAPAPLVEGDAAVLADSSPLTADVAATPDASTVLITMQQHEVTLKDYQDAVKRVALLNPSGAFEPIPEVALKTPRFQQTTLSNLFRSLVLRLKAKELSLVATPELLEARLASEPSLKALLPLSHDERIKRLGEADLTVDDLNVLLSERVLADLVAFEIVKEPEDATLWSAYKRLEERSIISFVAVPNTPSSQAISAFVSNNKAEIERHYRDNPKQFTRPTSRRVRLIGVDAVPEQKSKAFERISELHTLALGGADFAALARTHSAHFTGPKGGDLGFVVRQQRPAAFSVKVGEVSDPIPGPKGAWLLLKVEEEVPSHLRPLTPPIMREIAAKILRARAPNAEPLNLTKSLRGVWLDELKRKDGTTPALDRLLKKNVLSRQETLRFYAERDSDAFIPGIGRSRVVMSAAANLSPEQSTVTAPVFDKGNLYLLTLMSKGSASRTRFAADKAAFTQQFLKAKRNAAMRELVETARRQDGVAVDIGPIEATYGQLKDKSSLNLPPRPRP